jgi:hypothetical protein
LARARGPTSPNERVRQGKKFSPQVPAVAFGPSNRTVLCKASLRVYPSSIIAPEADRRGGDERTTTRRPGGLSAERGGPSPIRRAGIIKKVARSIQSNATVQVLPGLAGDVPSPSLIMRTKSQQNVKATGAQCSAHCRATCPIDLDERSFVSDKDARSLFGCGPL